MKAIIGLGNPGPDFQWTRHNAGFQLVERLATELDASFESAPALDAQIALANYKGNVLVLVKPQTGMNSSGVTARLLTQELGIEPANLIVAYDDVNLPMGRLRLAFDGGAGGHHGIESMIAELSGNRKFNRLKLGVGPDPGGAERYRFVLATMLDSDRPLYEKALDAASQAVQLWLEGGIDKAMCKYNGLDLR